MDGRFTYHSKLKSITAFGVALLLSLASLAFSLTAYAKPTIASVTPAQWKAGQDNKLAVTLQVAFPTILFDRTENIFSEIFNKIPQNFPGLKLNTIGRGMHSTLAYLEGMKLEGVKEVIRFFESLDRATLERYDLLNEVHVFDAANPEFVVVGTQSKFLALKPHSEFVQWQMRFYQLLADKAPQLLEKHLSHRNFGKTIDPNSIHISLIQWGERYGIGLSETEVEALKSKMKALFGAEVQAFEARHGRLPEVKFSLKTHPVELVLPPRSIQSGSDVVVAIKAEGDGQPTISQVVRWQIDQQGKDSGLDDYGDGHGTAGAFIELRTQDFMSGAEKPYDEILEDKAWIEKPRSFDPEPIESFRQRLRPEIARIFDLGIRMLSPTKLPAPVLTTDISRQNRFYVTTQTHPRLEPEKGFAALENARGLQLHSTDGVSIGVGLYASSIRKEIKNPGDLDMLVNSVVHVPDSIQSIEEAEAHAVRKFVQVTIGQLRELAKKGKIAFTELRLGSDATMGIPFDDVIAGLEENPYLSEEDIIKGEFKDKTGKVWSLEQLVALGDFMKGKVDLFTEHGRIDISLQFLAGYEWKGAMYTFQRNGIKGIAPLVRTGMYDGAESSAIAISLSRVFDYYASQKGPIVARAIRDLMKAAFGHSKSINGGTPAPVEAEPLWNSKFVKKFYNFLIMLRSSGLGLDDIFFKETKAVFERQATGMPEGFTIAQLVDHLLGAINQDLLKTINTLKRNVNDFREYNERAQHFRPDQWAERLRETASLLEEIEADIDSGLLDVTSEFSASMREFQDLFKKAKRQSTVERSIQYLGRKRLFDPLLRFEDMLTVVDGSIVAKRGSHGELTSFDREFVKALTAHSPHFLVRYLMTRSQDADAKMRWTLRLMGISPIYANPHTKVDLSVEMMKSFSSRLESMSKDEIAAAQKKFFSKKPSCLDLLTQKDAV